MPRILAMSTIRTRCKQRADMENESLISDSEWNALISEKYGELHGIVCDAGLRYFETAQSITATGATSYSEPTDHLATVRLDHLPGDGSRRTLREPEGYERSALSGQTGDALFYELIDDQIVFYPNPASGSYQLIYIPQSPDLSSYADADPVDVVTADGEAFLIWGVSVLAKSKSESDVRLAIEREAAARDRLQQWAVNRSMGEGRRRPANDPAFDPFSDGGP